MHYVIGDVHGCFDELMALFSQIESKDPHAIYILIGDLIDRGPKVWETITWAMKHITDTGKYQCVLGNHENAVLEWYYYKYTDWSEIESSAREASPMPTTKFDFSALVKSRALSRDQISPIMDFFNSLPSKKELELYSILPQVHQKQLHIENFPASEGDQNRDMIPVLTRFKIVHAWYMKGITDDKMQRHINIRRRCLTGNPEDSYIIVHGHTPTNKEDFLATDEGADRPGRICYRKNAINIDGGMCYGEKNGYKSYLCAICLETGEEFYAG